METERNFVVATDGSKKAVNAFRYSCELFRRANGYFSKIVVVSIIDPDKVYLPTDLQPKYLEESIKNSLLSRFPQSKYEVIMRRKEVNAKVDVLKAAKEKNAALLSIGFHGRKSESREKEGGHTILGSSVEHSMNFCTIPFLVCKTEFEQKDSYIFAACLDGSKKSFSALEYLLKISNENDKIIALYAPHLTIEKETREKIAKKLAEYPRVKFEELKGSQDPTEALVVYINDDPTYKFDFVLIGNNGERAEAEHKQFIGRTARKVLIETVSNIILYPEYYTH